MVKKLRDVNKTLNEIICNFSRLLNSLDPIKKINTNEKIESTKDIINESYINLYLFSLNIFLNLYSITEFDLFYYLL